MTRIIYVNAHNTHPLHDGNSWKTAYLSLQDALDNAALSVTKTKIWVAAGTYFPSKLYSPNNVPGGAGGITTIEMYTFDIPNNVTIYGGFSGCEHHLSERTLENKTILSGSCVNYHVVTLGNDIAQTGVSAKLKDLTISYGNAASVEPVDTIFHTFTYAHSYGGGLYVTFNSNVTVKNVKFKHNTGLGIGGAIFSINSNINIVESKFDNNSTLGQAGAVGIYNTYETQAHFGSIVKSVFTNNYSKNFGGAIVVEGTIPNVNTKTTIDKCIFKKNFAQEGGAVVVDSETVEIKCCEFCNNTSSVNAGALSTTNIVTTLASAGQTVPVTPVLFMTTIKNSIFNNNTTFGNTLYHDNLLGGQSAGIDFPLGGGAVVCYMNGLLTVKKSTFNGNQSENSDGGALLNGRSAAAEPFGISGLNVYNVKTYISKSEFENNFALRGNGGAIASEPSTYVFSPPLTIPIDATEIDISKSCFVKNKATLDGGAIYLNHSLSHLKCNQFKDNKGHPTNKVANI